MIRTITYLALLLLTLVWYLCKALAFFTEKFYSITSGFEYTPQFWMISIDQVIDKLMKYKEK